MDNKGMVVAGHNVTFTRRKYGKSAIYTWAHVEVEPGVIESVGDPYPAINWKKDELERAVRNHLKQKVQL